MFNVPKRYVPSFLTKKDKRKQSKELRRSRRAYKKGKYYTRKRSNKYKKSINCKNPKGFSQKQYCKYTKK